MIRLLILALIENGSFQLLCRVPNCCFHLNRSTGTLTKLCV